MLIINDLMRAVNMLVSEAGCENNQKVQNLGLTNVE